MIEELQRRNFAETTIRSYVHGVEHFSRYFHRSPDQLGPEHIRKYQAMLFSKLKFWYIWPMGCWTDKADSSRIDDDALVGLGRRPRSIDHADVVKHNQRRVC